MKTQKNTHPPIIAIFAAIAITATYGCKTTQYVPVETVRTESTEIDTTAIMDKVRSMFESIKHNVESKDSVVDRQKVTITINGNGDTTRSDRERIIYVSSRRETDLERMLVQRDSVIGELTTRISSVSADSIPVPYPVEKELTWWERTKINIGELSFYILIATIAFKMLKNRLYGNN